MFKTFLNKCLHDICIYTAPSKTFTDARVKIEKLQSGVRLNDCELTLSSWKSPVLLSPILRCILN
jgi:hypothetical protein